MSADEPTPHNNGAVHTVVQITKTVMSSATEAELGGLYKIHHEAVPMRHLLNELGQKQPPIIPTPVQTDTSTALRPS